MSEVRDFGVSVRERRSGFGVIEGAESKLNDKMPIALPILDDASALFLDVDGTLLEIAATPDAVVVPNGLTDVLQRLYQALGGALALVSGRALAELDMLFDPLRLPAAGQHGAELRRRGDVPVQSIGRDPRLDGFVRQLRAIAGERPGLLVEDKGLSVAVHYRLAPQYGEEVQAFATALLAECGGDIELLPLRMGIEFKPRATSKRTAVEWFLRAAPFHGRVPIFVGDDRTDEDGFAAALGQSGHALRVGLDGDSLASMRLATPQDVRDWLARCAAGLA
jgi:trehalose 6-phosphate phosphatase